MAFTNAWSTTIPPGTLDANKIDTAIQQTRLDIAERINQILGSVSTMSSDPIINGTTLKDLSTLTAELGTKTTISGLITNRVVIATSATNIGNSSITDAQLVAAVNNGINPTKSLDNHFQASGTIFTAPKAGLILVNASIQALIIGGGGDVVIATLASASSTTKAAHDGYTTSGGNKLIYNLTLIANVAAGEAITVSVSGVGVFNTSLISLYSYVYLQE